MLGAIAVRRYVDSMAAKGYPPELCLSDAGIEHARLADPDCRITPAQYRLIVSRLISLSGDDGIELASSTFRDLADLGIVGHASAASRTVRDTYRVWTRFGPTLLGMMGQLQIHAEDSDSVSFGVASPDPADPLYRFSVEELLTMVKKVSRTPEGYAPSIGELSLSYAAPRHAEVYEAMFGCPIRFRAPRTTIRVWKDWFDRPAQLHDAEFSALCLQHCETVLQRFGYVKPMAAELRWLFKRTPGNSLPSLEQAAACLNLSARTLRRRLAEEGTRYRDEINEFRAEQAVKLLSYGTLSVKEIAFALGFQDQSAFRHAFKSWTGKSVGAYRQDGEAH